jgi:DNA-directed RNA polymerase specialized sigma24 family protein
MAQRLVKTKPDGTPYTRPPEIERAIDIALAQDLNMLDHRAKIFDPKAKDYLPSECLVHLVRRARRCGDEQASNKLLPMLLARCEGILRSKVDWKIAGAPELCEDIVAEFATLFAIDGSAQDRHELDGYEVRFNLAFRCFRITRLRPELKRLNREMVLPDPDFPDAPIDEEVLAHLSELHRATDPEQRVFLNQVRAAIMTLPPEEQRALILCYSMGFKEESAAPNETTAATLCGVTGRTIRNRLARAKARLSRLKEDA